MSSVVTCLSDAHDVVGLTKEKKNGIHQFHFLLLHDFSQLCPDFSNLPHGLDVDEVLAAPLARISVGLPLLVDVQVGQVVRLGDLELFPRVV